MKGITIRLYEPSDLEAYTSYISESFHSRYILLNPEFRSWQFTGIMVAVVGNTIVGQLGYKDLTYERGGKTETIRVLANLHVREEYRLGVVAALLTNEVLKVPYPMLVSGYTPNAYLLYKRVRPTVVAVGNLRRFLKILKPEHAFFAKFPATQYTLPDSTISALPLVTITSADSRFDELWKKVKEEYGFSLTRSSEYINWRFCTHPLLSYEVRAYEEGGILKGYAVYRIERAEDFSIARIIDLVAFPESRGPLISLLGAEIRAQGVSAIDFMLSSDLYNDTLKASGFFETKDTPFYEFPILFSPVSWSRFEINLLNDAGVSLEDSFFTKADGDQDRPNPQ